MTILRHPSLPEVEPKPLRFTFGCKFVAESFPSLPRITGPLGDDEEDAAQKWNDWVRPLVELQAQLFDRALGWLRPGGRLVYCTCSLLPEEGEGQLAAALVRHPGLRVIAPVLRSLDPAWITEQGGLRLRPDYWADKGGMDGFFMVALERS